MCGSALVGGEAPPAPSPPLFTRSYQGGKEPRQYGVLVATSPANWRRVVTLDRRRWFVVPTSAALRTDYKALKIQLQFARRREQGTGRPGRLDNVGDMEGPDSTAIWSELFNRLLPTFQPDWGDEMTGDCCAGCDCLNKVLVSYQGSCHLGTTQWLWVMAFFASALFPLYAWRPYRAATSKYEHCNIQHLPGCFGISKPHVSTVRVFTSARPES